MTANVMNSFHTPWWFIVVYTKFDLETTNTKAGVEWSIRIFAIIYEYSTELQYFH